MPDPTAPGSASGISTPDEEEKPFVEAMGTEIVRFHVGPKRKEFSVHRDLVSRASTIFDIKLDANGLDFYVDDELCLPDDDPLAMQDFITFLYRDAKTVASYPRTHTEYINLYIFADKYDVNALKDIAVDGIQDKLRATDTSLTTSEIKHIFAKTSPSYPYPNKINHLQRFCAASISNYIHEPKGYTIRDIHKLLKHVPELMIEFLYHERRTSDSDQLDVGEDPRARSPNGQGGFTLCYFHCHAKEKPCGTESNDALG